MPRLLPMILLPLLPLALGGCGLLAKWFGPRANPAPEEQNTGIGVIEMVNPEQRFVLIRANMKVELQPGSKLETLTASGVKSVLAVSPEQKLNFLSADILEGYPQKGETVTLAPKSVSVVPESTPALPQPAGNLPPLPPPIQ